ncbi:DUF1302 family protein [Marinomonas sp. THO17]|uniref:DUF1302 domain-containing protein n=1 Tax=Marinomonas sp. THO17 TaxID=3149048 RepID=UPI00336C2CF3
MNIKIKKLAPLKLSAVALSVMSCSPALLAFEIETGNSDLRLTFDNTVKYSTAFRLKDASNGLNGTDNPSQGANQNDGDNNFDKGLVSNRLDLLTELDLSYKDVGFRVSGTAWYDEVYHGNTDNTSSSSNHSPASEFSDEAKEVMGGDTDLLDAFAYAYFPVSDGMEGTVRLGRHSLLWGESLYFGINGIAGGQAPLDIVKLASVPNSQFKEIALPTGKLSVDVPLTEALSLGAYVGYEWEKSRLAPAGAYLSSSDTLGGERLLAGSNEFTKIGDQEAEDDGQYGLQLRWSDYDTFTDYGIYATRYHATTISNIYTILNSSFQPSEYQFAYQEGIEAYGFSMAKSVGIWSLAGEISYRRNAPLASKGQSITPTGTQYDNDSNPGYAVGETAHAQFSWIGSLGPSFIAKEASFTGEIAWNTRVKTTDNESMLNPNADKSAVALRMVYSPTYRQFFDGVDLTPSVGLGHTWGKSSAVGAGFGVDGGGDLNLGIKAVYLSRWNFSMNYTKYLGEEGYFLDGDNNAQYKQALKDRDFISASVQTVF